MLGNGYVNVKQETGTEYTHTPNGFSFNEGIKISTSWEKITDSRFKFVKREEYSPETSLPSKSNSYHPLAGSMTTKEFIRQE